MSADRERGVLPVVPPPIRKSVEAEVDEGVMLLENAVRLKLKNRIIVDTLTGGEAGPRPDAMERWADLLADQLSALAMQSAENAQRLAVERDVSSTIEGRGRYYHDYRHLDTDNLSRRVQLAVEVARRLRAMAADEEVLARLLADARTLADDELTAATRAALATDSSLGAEDTALLEARIARLATIDVPALAEVAARRAGSPSRPDGLVRRLMSLLIHRGPGPGP